MIVRKFWCRRQHRRTMRTYQYEGWFLFGLIPLYVFRQGSNEPA